MAALLLDAGARAAELNGEVGGKQTALEVARLLHKIERGGGAAAEAVSDCGAWRGRWGKPAAGRARLIALLGGGDVADDDQGGEAAAAAGAEAAELAELAAVAQQQQQEEEDDAAVAEAMASEEES